MDFNIAEGRVLVVFDGKRIVTGGIIVCRDYTFKQGSASKADFRNGRLLNSGDTTSFVKRHSHKAVQVDVVNANGWARATESEMDKVPKFIDDEPSFEPVASAIPAEASTKPNVTAPRRDLTGRRGGRFRKLVDRFARA